MDWYCMKIRQVVKELKTTISSGLTDAEAEKRLIKNGENALPQKKKRSVVVLFLEQFKDFMIIILILAAVISFVMGIVSGEGDFVDPIIIMSIVILNAVVGVCQQVKAEKAIDALKSIYSPVTDVLRQGQLKSVDTKNLVVGDIVYLKQGDIVPADCRVVEAFGLKASEANLTGEAMAVEKRDCVLNKNAVLAERENMLYMGTSVISGRGNAVVVAVGSDTEMGRIADMLNTENDEETPLQKRLAETGKVLGLGALGICFIIFFIGIGKQLPVFDMFMTSVSLAVAAIPEGLPAVVTVMLAIGVQRMAGQRAIIRHLPAVETLGCATVICSDKTGTLTQNNMTVAELKSESTDEAIKYFVLCTDSKLAEDEIKGEPMENALVRYGMERGFNKNELEKYMPRVEEIPFNSERKLMTTIHSDNKEFVAITKGAGELLLEKCAYYSEGNVQRVMTPEKKKMFLKAAREMAEKALRVIGVAYKRYSVLPLELDEKCEKELVFCGFAGLLDPPRPEVRAAVDVCKRAGILPVMITGDNPLTAKSIGEKVGLISSNEGVLSGSEIEKMSQKELENAVYKYKIYARVSPEHKVRIVRAFKANGEVVAMTGDGVNDAPALKTADIGCAMGMSGTEVAKGAADMVLTDDNFATIVRAVKEGRGIYANIQKAVQFLLSSNIGEIITIFVGMLTGFNSPLMAIQLLWVNLVTDSMPAVALGLDPCNEDVMHNKPVRNKNLFSVDKWWDIILQGCMIGMLALLGYGIGKVYFGDENIGRSMCFAILSISQLVHAFNMRNEGSLLDISIFENIYLDGAFILGTLMQVAVIQSGLFNTVFRVVALSCGQWLIVSGMCILPVVIVECQKLVKKL